MLDRAYVIVVPHREDFLKEFPENPHRAVIGPFATKDEATAYLNAAGSQRCKVTLLLAPIDPTDDEALEG